jgi:cob(I)alamin adenosyltransferase
MDISSFIATPPWHELKPVKGDIEELIETWISKVSIDFNEIKRTEILIDRYESFLQPIKNFVVPGNDILVSSIHICRSVTRRCERSYIEFLQSDLLCYGVYEHVDCHFNNVQVYLNRLSDFFFVISRFLSFSLNVEEECYSKSKGIL